MASFDCRNCAAPLTTVFADLGNSPLSNAYLTREQLSGMETYYPLCAYVCSRCFLVQLPAFESPQAIFEEYAYFSSYSQSWLEHARLFAAMAIDRFGLTASSLVTEVASNDGYLLQYFKSSGIPVLGVEPARNVADAALARGIPTVSEFLGRASARQIARQAGKADLVVGNNVLAHVPDLHDFVAGLAELLKPGGTLSLEFPHLLQLMANGQFDTIYHEHFSYFSLSVASDVLARHDLQTFDVEELPTHGGSLRVFAAHRARAAQRQTARVGVLLAKERAAGLDRLETYAAFGERVKAAKRELLSFLIRARDDGRSVAAYGAPAKGNTLLTYCGIRTDLLDYTVDRNPYKQGRFLPGSHIPVYAPEKIAETKPDYVLILPWNLRDEIVAQLHYIRQWGGRFVVPIPRLEVLP